MLASVCVRRRKAIFVKEAPHSKLLRRNDEKKISIFISFQRQRHIRTRPRDKSEMSIKYENMTAKIHSDGFSYIFWNNNETRARRKKERKKKKQSAKQKKHCQNGWTNKIEYRKSIKHEKRTIYWCHIETQRYTLSNWSTISTRVRALLGLCVRWHQPAKSNRRKKKQWKRNNGDAEMRICKYRADGNIVRIIEARRRSGRCSRELLLYAYTRSAHLRSSAHYSKWRRRFKT